MKKRLLGLLCALGILVSIIMPASAAFNDVPSSHWAYNDITKFTSFGAINGYPDGSFHPDSNITYAEVATVYHKFFGDTGETRSFPDVTRDHWAYDAITNAGIWFFHQATNSSGNFMPGTNAQRQDIAFILGIFVSAGTGKNAADQRSNFSDYNKILTIVAPYVDLAVEAKLINGYSDGTFQPAAPVTRAEFVVMLNRLNTYMEAIYPSSIANSVAVEAIS